MIQKQQFDEKIAESRCDVVQKRQFISTMVYILLVTDSVVVYWCVAVDWRRNENNARDVYCKAKTNKSSN